MSRTFATNAAVLATVAVLTHPVPAWAAETLAHVDGEPITAENLRDYRSHFPERKNPAADQEAARNVLLEELINHRLLLKAARKRNLAEEPNVRQALRWSRREILVESLLDRVVADRVTEERVRAYYRRHFGSSDRVAQIRLVERTAPTRAEAVRLAKGLSESSGAGGWVLAPLRSPALEKALGSAEKGETVGPVATDGHWAVMLVTDRRRTTPPPFEEVREDIRKRLETEAIQELLASLRERARISYPNSAGADQAPE